jgi:hypothetical protein
MNDTTNATELDLALTRDHIKGLRTADRVCFDHVPGGGGAGEFRTGLRAIKTVKGPWREEITLQVPAMSSVHVHSDLLDYDTRNGANARCFEMLYGTYNEEWQTIAGLLKPGDVLELRWVGNDSNGYLKRATVTEAEKDGICGPGHGQGLRHDKLYVHIRRGGKRKYSFYLADSICPDNTARMIKPNG